MKKEDIEKAATKNIENVLDSTIDCTIINNEEDNYEAGRRDALLDFGSDIFKAGADWRINSVWHDVSEAPKGSRDILALNNKGVFCTKSIAWKDGVKLFNIVKWAYIEDLMPNKED